MTSGAECFYKINASLYVLCEAKRTVSRCRPGDLYGIWEGADEWPWYVVLPFTFQAVDHIFA